MTDDQEPGMTNNDDPVRKPPPPRRKAPSPKSRPDARRNGNGERSTSSEDRVAVSRHEFEDMLARLTQVEAVGTRFIESQPDPRPDIRVADPGSLSDFQRTLLAQTHEKPADFETRPKRTYNFPDLLYLKPDGTFVWLQGSPQARAYYDDKGFRLLNEAETKYYVQVERPRLVKEQRQKAHLISTIRKMFLREPALAGYRGDPDYDASLDLMSIPQLEDEWEDLRARSVNPNQKLPPLPRFKSDVDAEAKRMLSGVDTAETMESLESKLEGARRSGRLVEVPTQTFR